jgi:hypothetical protein
MSSFFVHHFWNYHFGEFEITPAKYSMMRVKLFQTACSVLVLNTVKMPKTLFNIFLMVNISESKGFRAVAVMHRYFIDITFF